MHTYIHIQRAMLPSVSSFCSATVRCGTLRQIGCPVPCFCLSPVLCSVLQGLLDVSLLWSREACVKGWLGLTVGIFGLCLKIVLNLSDLVAPPAVLEEAEKTADFWVIITVCVVGHGRSRCLSVSVQCLCLTLITYSVYWMHKLMQNATHRKTHAWQSV